MSSGISSPMPLNKHHPISFLRPNPAELMPIAEHEKTFQS